MHQLTDDLTEALAPKTGAYHELWVTDPETRRKDLGRRRGRGRTAVRTNLLAA